LLSVYIEWDNVANTTHQLIEKQTVDHLQNSAAEPDNGNKDEKAKVEEAEQPKATIRRKKTFEALRAPKLFGLSAANTERTMR